MRLFLMRDILVNGGDRGNGITPSTRETEREKRRPALWYRTHRMVFELQPHLVGDLLELRPLRPDDWDGLFTVASDPLIWEQHPARDRYKEEVFNEFFREALETGSAFVVIDRKTQRTIGSSRYFGLDLEKREIEIGWTFLARSHWGGKYNAELKRLMLDHAFKFVETVVLLLAPTNGRSRKAVERIGGVMRERRAGADPHRQNVEHLVYEIKKP